MESDCRIQDMGWWESKKGNQLYFGWENQDVIVSMIDKRDIQSAKIESRFAKKVVAHLK